MKPGCYDCRRGSCYHIDINNLHGRIDILQSAVDMLQDRLDTLMTEQQLPFVVELSDEDAQKIKDWINDDKD